MTLNGDARCICLSGFPEGRTTECPVHGNLPSTKAGCDGYLTRCLCEGGGYRSFQRVKGKDVWRCVACGATVKFIPADVVAEVREFLQACDIVASMLDDPTPGDISEVQNVLAEAAVLLALLPKEAKDDPV